MGTKSDVKWEGIHTFIKNEIQYNAKFKATGTYWYDPGRMYMPNGDPGYPPEEEIEVQDIVIESIIDENGDDVLDGLSRDTDFMESLEETISDKIYDGEYETICPEEPDYEDWEE